MNNQPKPNILLITNDEHNCGYFAGGLVEKLETPTFDRLRQMGVFLPNAVTNCPVCMPTRFTWVTGLYGSQSPSGPRNAKNWPMGHPTVAQALQRAGYQTAMIGKVHAYHGACDLDDATRKQEMHARGFDYVFPSASQDYFEYLQSKGLPTDLRMPMTSAGPKQSSDEKLGGEEPSPLPVDEHYDDFVCHDAVRWLGEHAAERPFYMHASFTKPHFPLDPPEPYFSKYKPEDMPAPVGVEDPERIEYWKRERAVYCGLVEYNDRCIGKLLDKVEASGLLENTLIIFTTDHGDMMGDHDMYFKLKPYDGSVRTPTIVYDPYSKRAGGTVLPDSVEAVDIPATLLEAGSEEHLQEALPTSPGWSILGYVRGERDAHRSWAFSELGNLCEEGGAGWRMARTPEWKYVYSGKGDLLFNMVEDPLETTNLAGDPAQLDRLHEMRGWLIRRMGSLSIPPAQLTCHTDPSDIKSLNSRFYRGIITGSGTHPSICG